MSRGLGDVYKRQIRYDFSVDFKNRAIYRNVMPLDSIIKNDLAMN